MTTKRNTQVPRPVRFKGIGGGDIIEEAAIDEYDEWAPAFQVMKFTDGERAGERALRFCYYVKSGQLARRALWIDEKDIEKLKKEIKKNPQIRGFLERLLDY